MTKDKQHAVVLHTPQKVGKDESYGILFDIPISNCNLLFLTGDTVRVVYRRGYDTTPLFADTSYYYNGFTGFKI